MSEHRAGLARADASDAVGCAGERLLSIVHSAPFHYLLSELTGVWQLLPDPYFQGAGYAVIRQGYYFHTQSDRSVASYTGLTRRLAMIVFFG